MTGPPNRHGVGGNSSLDEEQQHKLWNHIRALEVLDGLKADIAEDIKTRKEIAKGDGFDVNIIGVVLKRRKAGEGQTSAADSLLQLYEAALREQKALPLEQTRRPPEADDRRTAGEVAEDLHGEPPPEDMLTGDDDKNPTIN